MHNNHYNYPHPAAADLPPAAVTRTTAPLTFYVRAWGSDNNSGLSEEAALATIQEAVDRIPHVIEHKVVVDVGEGTFPGFVLASKWIVDRNWHPYPRNPERTTWYYALDELAGLLVINGKLGSPDLAGGRPAGKATEGSSLHLSDPSQHWQEHALRGKLLHIDEEYRLIRSNTATEIVLAHPMPFRDGCTGKDYTIVEQKTVIRGVSRDGANTALIHTMCGRAYWLRNLRVEAESTNLSALAVTDSDGGYFEHISTVGGVCGALFQRVGRYLALHDLCATQAADANIHIHRSDNVWPGRLFAYDGGKTGGILALKCRQLENVYLCSDDAIGSGIYLTCCQYLDLPYVSVNRANGPGMLIEDVHCTNFSSVFLTDNVGSGLTIHGADWLDLDGGVIENNGGYGIEIDDNSGGNRYSGSCANLLSSRGISVQGNKLGGIIARHDSKVHLSSISGSNGGYGLSLMDGSKATITGTTAITGEAGDATIDEGASTLSWADDFPTDGTKRADLESLCLISRREVPRTVLGGSGEEAEEAERMERAVGMM